MKVVTVSDVPEEEVVNSPIFTGKITRQSIVTETDGSDISLASIRFTKGVRNKFHTHSKSQILIVTKGNGIVKTEKETIQVKEGDIIYIPKGEKHWHGAAPDSEFTHISITPAGTQFTQLEK